MGEKKETICDRIFKVLVQVNNEYFSQPKKYCFTEGLFYVKNEPKP